MLFRSYLSQEAEKYGVDGILLVSPYYNKATQKGSVSYTHLVPNKDIKSAEHCKCVREFARRNEITNYFEVGEMGIEHAPVSYTHLDVYKRQSLHWPVTILTMI